MHAMTELLVKITSITASYGHNIVLTTQTNGLIINAQPNAGLNKDQLIVTLMSGAFYVTALPLDTDTLGMWEFYTTEDAWKRTR